MLSSWGRMAISYRKCNDIIQISWYVYVTGFIKTVPKVTRGEIQITAGMYIH